MSRATHPEIDPARIGGADCRDRRVSASGSGVFSDDAFKTRLRKSLASDKPKKEHGAQVRLMKEIRKRGIPKLVVFAVPNAGKRSMKLAEHMRAEGMRAGVADLVFTIPPMGHVAYLEMKREKGGRVGDEQRRFAREVIDAGALHAIANGFDEAVAVLKGWGVLK